ncbi:MAG TPA: hypothetical protein VM491_10705 [Burkholderiaceae bacterium]|nr:hypothetical protein [Burkholderiaceae bacterium]
MRIGTQYAHQQAIDTIAQQQAKQLQTQQQLASGRRIASPSDDPHAAAESEKMRSRVARIEAEQRAVTLARQLLGASEAAVADGTAMLQSARDTLLAAANPTLGSADRAHLAVQLRQTRESLLAIANRGDGAGGFVFGGQGTSAAPFDASGDEVAYRPQPGTQSLGSEQPATVGFDGAANFTAVPAAGGPQNVFTRLDAAIALLSDPNVSSAAVGDAMRATVGSVDRSLERLQLTRVTIGERLRALDVHEQALESGSIDAQARLSQLVDVDFARAISQMQLQHTAVEAAMKSYAQVARLTLFDYL